MTHLVQFFFLYLRRLEHKQHDVTETQEDK